MPHPTLNNALFTLGLLLQLALLITLFARHIPRHYPIFTTLLAFYPLRALFLFAIFGHIPPDDYETLYTNLSLVDILLQLAVAIELIIHIVRTETRATLRRFLTPLVAILIGYAATAAIVSRLPTRTPIPIDRSQLFLSILMLLLFLWAFIAPPSRLLRRITTGFALNALLSLCVIAGHTLAATHRNASAYNRWSYVAAAAWLITVTLWLVTLKPSSQTNA